MLSQTGRTSDKKTKPTASAFPWERTGLGVLLLGTLISFLWGLDRNGWANPFYSAAVQAGSVNWEAFFYGSTDAGNLITVDKPPLSLWIMALSVRLFGLSSWSILVPQALMGVATVWLIYKIIRRSYPATPALLGGLIYATTPVVVLMSRYNNPEPVMGLLMVVSCYFILRALEDNRWRWYLLAGAGLGFGFMAKQIQAFIMIPALLLAILAFGIGSLIARIMRLVAALAVLIACGGWWMAVVDLTPASVRPYIGGSQTNSVLELTLDYNGLARLVQFPIAKGGGPAEASSADLAPYDGGFSRLLNGNFAPEAGWALATAVMCLLVVSVLHSLLPKSRLPRALVALAGAWFLTSYLVLSFMGTMIHTYYVYSLAAPVALLVPLGLHVLWMNRTRLIIRIIGATLIASATYMTVRILAYSNEWSPYVAPLVASVGALATVLWILSAGKRVKRITASLVALTLIAGPVATNLFTISSPQEGTNPVSGPVSNNPDAISSHLRDIRGGQPAWALQVAYGADPSPKVVQLLTNMDASVTWPVATYSAQNASKYQLATLRPVISVGGWLGMDPAPTLERFKTLVAQGRVGYFIWQQDIMDLGELGPQALAITSWVRENFKEESIDGVRIYRLRH
ncbi:glycosyltransferase family 39 protein [Arthrobacter sp. M-10]|uniref:glycosyltransferase family 39 protein n=1 Tax=Arthrobacter sp. M-10 TaxID=3233037 RepID=UPI003F8E3D8E